MPLPPDGTISLLGSSRPGETSQSRPKQAMIIRMSEKTLNLLESFPQLHFEFSDNPGVHIGDTFFPVTSVPELSPHDLYLRTSSAAKRNAPLKLYANVTGKFTVERQLDDRITGKVRASTVDAQKERAGRTTIFVETPSNLPPPNGKRKKEPSMFMKKTTRPSDQSHSNTPSASAVPLSHGVSPAFSSVHKNKETLQTLRARMIRCIAVAERTSDQVVKLVGGNDCSGSMKRDILDMLEEIAEPVPLPSNSKALKNFRLKGKSWLDVRPYEIPGLTESERTNLARAAKLALRDLKIPESDPAWNHVQYRNPNGSQVSEPFKRGITSKEKKTKSRNKPGEIMMKNESLKASNQLQTINNGVRDEDPTLATLKPATSRNRPGSGFKAKPPALIGSRDLLNGHSPLPTGVHATAESNIFQDKDSTSSTLRRPLASQPQERRSIAIIYQKDEKLRKGESPGSDAEKPDRIKGKGRQGARKEQEEGVRERRERERERDLEKERVRLHETGPGSDAKHERSRKVREKGRGCSQEREEGEHSDDSFRPTKRKKISREDDAYEDPLPPAAQKRRKIDSPPHWDTKTKDLGLPKKPETDLPSQTRPNKESSSFPPLSRIKKEPAPFPKTSTLLSKSSPSDESQVSTLRPKTGTKLRRKSPVFTSSEDEGEIRLSVNHETPTTTVLSGINNRQHEVHPQRRPNSFKPLPGDHSALRARYNASYLDYVDAFQKLMREKTKIENKLSLNMDKLSVGSTTDSDGDVELLDPDELRRLTSNYIRLHEELGGIRRVISGNRKTGSGSE